jgi:23S rRNA (cytidine1920-2'-O)/16S rRNA (cytidine1409-2'-O)-methyltransferase
MERQKRNERLDIALVRRGLVGTRERAQGLILARGVLVAGSLPAGASQRVGPETTIELRGPVHPYVGRGGLKLEAALDAFGIDPTDRVALDVGASTGGFTDCLLQRGASKVYAVDVCYGQLARRHRRDPRVVVIERCNARFLTPLLIGEPIQLATVDVSFISLALILPAVARTLSSDAHVVALLKPQFEIGKGKLGKGGVIRDETDRRATVTAVRQGLEAQGWRWLSELRSPVVGQKGNVEYLIELRPPINMSEKHAV